MDKVYIKYNFDIMSMNTMESNMSCQYYESNYTEVQRVVRLPFALFPEQFPWTILPLKSFPSNHPLRAFSWKLTTLK